jgi:uncharacterized protein (UPF0548 family)
LTRPSPEDLARLLASAKEAHLSYPEVGATRELPLPTGYRVDRYECELDPDEATFDRAVEALRSWKAHLGAGVEVVPDDARVTVGETVLLLVKTAGLWVAAPCRVVYLIDEPHRFGFAYGTLPGHPEQGEAAMIVEASEIGTVVFRIVSFSRTVDPLARLASPLTRRIQRRVTNRYVKALATASQRPVRSSARRLG